MLPLLYNSRMDVAAERREEFADWYKRRHGPDLVAAGFYSANAYQALQGGPWSCNFYEIPSVSIFGAQYDEVRDEDDQLAEIVASWISNHSLTVYRQLATLGLPVEVEDDARRPHLASAIGAPVVSTVRFDLADGDDAMRWFEQVEGPRLYQRDGCVSVRLCRQDGVHPVYPSTQPGWAVVAEWASEDTALADGGVEAAVERVAAGLADAERIMADVVGHVFTLRNQATWVA